MKDIICCFAGHRDIYSNSELKKKIYNKCEELICEKNENCFWVGLYGGFDKITAETVIELKKKYTHIKLELILPYVTKRINDNKEFYYKNFDNLVVENANESTPMKLRIIKCNQYMVKNSNYMICFINNCFGGSGKTFE